TIWASLCIVTLSSIATWSTIDAWTADQMRQKNWREMYALFTVPITIAGLFGSTIANESIQHIAREWPRAVPEGVKTVFSWLCLVVFGGGGILMVYWAGFETKDGKEAWREWSALFATPLLLISFPSATAVTTSLRHLFRTDSPTRSSGPSPPLPPHPPPQHDGGLEANISLERDVVIDMPEEQPDQPTEEVHHPPGSDPGNARSRFLHQGNSFPPYGRHFNSPPI
ncbi:hypothetical protein PFISCL1PPCAC_26096, partial [Pristionchus fissidentatus]